MEPKNPLRILPVLSLIFLITAISLAADSTSPYANKPVGSEQTVHARSAASGSPELPFDPNNYDFMIYDCQGEENSIQDAMKKIGINSFTVRNASNPVTLEDLDSNDVLIVGWDIGGGDKSGLIPNTIEQGITGRVILSGHDSDFHTVRDGNAAETFFIQEIAYILKGSGTGLIVCADVVKNFSWLPESWDINARILLGDSIAYFTPDGNDSGLYEGLTPESMSDWGYSYHNVFDEWSDDFVSFEVGTDNNDINDVVTIAKTIGSLFIEKVADVNYGDYVGPGVLITYTIDYNYPAGPNLPDYNDVNIIDYLPPEVDFNEASSGGIYNSDTNTVTWNIGTVSPGTSGSRTLKVLVKAAPQGDIIDINNVCEVKSANTTIDWAFENTPVYYPMLTKVDDVNDSNCVKPDDYITYNIDYAANGYGDTNVVITDFLPDEVEFISSVPEPSEINDSNVIWNIGTLGPDDSGRIALTVKVGCVEPSSTITNQCEMVGEHIYGITASEHTLVCSNYPTLSKVDDTNGCVGPGETITYNIRYDANGYPDTNVIITDFLPDEVEYFLSVPEPNGINDSNIIWNIGTLGPDESGCITLTVKVKDCVEPCIKIKNCFEMTGDCITTAIIACEDTPVCCPTLTKVDDVSYCVEPNETITYNICYTANGYSDTNVEIIDDLPDEVNYVSSDPCGAYDPCSNKVTWDMGTLEPNDFGCLELVVQVKTNTEQDTIITNHCEMVGDCNRKITTDKDTLVCPPGSYINEVLTDGPVLWLRFEDYPLVDSSGNEYWIDNDNEFEPIEKTPGSLGKAVYLNNNYVAAANQKTEPNLPTEYGHQYAFAPNDISFELWFKADADCGDEVAFFNQAETNLQNWQDEPNRAPAAGRSGTQMRAMTYAMAEESNGWRYTEPNVWPTDGDWHHLVVTYDEDFDGNYDTNEPNDLGVKMYLDAELVLDTHDSGGGTVGPEMDHILLGHLGSRDKPGWSLYSGYIDEFAIYPGVLSPDRIEAHYYAWQPNDCQEIRDRLLIWDIDRNQDCRIDFYDFAVFAEQWALCNDPGGGEGCVPNW